MQINLDMEPVSSYPIMKDLPKVVLPMLWLEEKISMNKTFTDEMKIMILYVNILISITNSTLHGKKIPIQTITSDGHIFQ